MNNSYENLPTQPPLAVVGLSALFPKASNAQEFWSNIRRGVDAITEVPATHWNPDDYFDENPKSPDMTYARRGGFLSPVPFDPLEFGISPNNLEAIDTSQLLGMVGAKRALEHAGYGAGRTFDRSRVGCILGVTGTLEMVIPLGARLGHPRWRKALKDAGVPDDVAEDVVIRISQSYVPWQENSFPGLLGNVVAGRIANRLDLHGTNCVVDAACASSLSAIHLAALELWTGRSDMVVTGGIDTFNDIFMFMCFSKTPALSPSGDAKPFSDEADGTILGEGVGMLVLKRQADAERDGDRIYAILKGIGTSSDGAGNAVYAPKADGQIRCLQDAYRVAGVTPDTIELVEAHGTGTKVGDATEVSGLMQVFQSTGRRGAWCAVGSVKSQIGHTKAAAGAAGVIKAILALQHRVLPPTIKVNQPPASFLTEESPFYVNTEARPWVKPSGYPRRAAVSAFGFGGSNFHCVLEESPQSFNEPEWDGDVQVVALSAPSVGGLADLIRSKLVPLAASEWRDVRTMAAQSRGSFCVQDAHRVLFVIERDRTELSKLTTGALTMLERYSDKVDWSTPDGVFYGRGERRGKLGVLFPGQGSQYVGMLRELVCQFPAMSDVLSEANEVFKSASPVVGNKSSKSRLSDYIFPQSSFSADARAKHDSELRATQIAQPAIGAVSLAVLAVLDQFGVQPEAVAGHSYGELTALCASRRFGPQVLYRLSMLRGQLMAAAQEIDGGMLAVGAPLAQIEAALKELSVDLVVANHNSPTQVVLSGRIPEIDRATSLFASRNIRGKKLSVAAAFHSPLVATASHAFRPVLDEVDFVPSSMPVYANSTGTEYPAEPQAARDLLAAQLARPVQFVREVEQMHADGVRTFLEVGPGSVLTGLVNSILNGLDYRAVAIDSSNGKRTGLYDLACALAQLSAAGNPVGWQLWDPQSDNPTEPVNPQRLRIPICGANYVKPRPPIPPRAPMNLKASMPESVVEASTTDRREPVREVTQTVPSVTELRPVDPAKSEFQTVSNFTRALPLDVTPPMQNSIATPKISKELSQHVAVARTTDAEKINTIRQTLEALQRMQQQTAQLHQQFLEGQEAALKTFARLVDLPFGGQQEMPRSDRQSPAAKQALVLPPVQPPEPEQSVVRFNAPSEVSPPPAAAVPKSVSISPVRESVPLKPAISVAPPPAVMTPPPVIPKPITESKSASSQTSEVKPSVISPLASQVLNVVSEKTGYPTEMLNLDMSLDHDLGIDSIKRVEILSALQERIPNLPAFQSDELGTLHTLRDVVTLADARIAKSPAPAKNESVVEFRTTVPTSGSNASSRSSEASKSPVVQPATESQSSLLGPTVLAVVSEKTGYPTEMLNLDMSLDHDLGIDSIKRVEILSALQERVPNLPAFQPEELGALHTLRDVVRLADVRSNQIRPEVADSKANPLSQVIAAPKNERDVAVPSVTGASILGPTVLAVVSEKTGYPTEMLNLDMSLDHDLGIDSIKRVEILSALQERVPNLPAFQPEELGALHTLRDVVRLADARSNQIQPQVTGGLAIPASQVSAIPTTNGMTTSTTVPMASSEPQSPSKEAGSLREPSALVPAGRSEHQPPSGTSQLSGMVLEVVSEKTGYPIEMLNLEMSLDHDLGIDSIKRVEILSALQERVPNLPAFQPEELGSLHTLKDVVTLADARMPKSVVSQGQRTAAVSGSATRPVPPVSASIERSVIRSDSPQTATAVSTPTLPMTSSSAVTRSVVRPVALSPATTRPGVNVLPGSEFLITEDELGLSLQVAEELTNRGFRTRIVNLNEPHFPMVSEGLAGIVIIAPRQGMSEQELWCAVEWLQKVRLKLRHRSESSPAIVATVSRLDGRFGFEGTQRLWDPISGGLAGLAKCASLEWPEVISRAFDLSPEWSTPNVAASMLVTELLHEGPVEVGLTPAGPIGLEIVEDSLAGHHMTAPVKPGDVIIVSGGARGVTAEAALAIARAWQPRLVILGRSPEPTLEPDWLANLSTETEIKQAIIARSGAGITPKAVAAQTQQIMAGREVSQQLHRLRSSGASVVYHSVDVRDSAAVKPLLARIQTNYGVIRGIIHGAGVLADQRIEDKTRDQFDRVYQTKIQGLKSLIECIDPRELRVLGIFSSYTARFGRVGQSDYAIANEVLNKQARQFAILYPECRVASFNWGPWDGGMVNAGLKQLFASEGVGLIPLEAGAELLVREFCQTATRPVEVLVLANSDSSSQAPPPSNQPDAPAVALDGGADFKVAFERELDVANHPFLESHVLGGKAVLPVALILEWLAHGAIHRNPGLELSGFRGLRIYQGIRLGLNDRIPLRVLYGKSIREGGNHIVPVRLVGRLNGRDLIHAAGDVILCSNYSAASTPALRLSTQPYSMDVAKAYSTRLFHGAQFRGIKAIEGCSEEGIIVAVRPSPAASAWMLEPVRANWLADPLVIDSALQAIILWSQEFRGKPCLPCAVMHYQQFCRVFPRDGVRIVIRIQPGADQLIRCDMEFVDLQGRIVAQAEGCESVAEASLSTAFHKNHIDN